MLATKNTVLSTGFTFSPVRNHLMIQTELLEKKRGARAATMLPSYCPFCGEKYEHEVETAGGMAA